MSIKVLLIDDHPLVRMGLAHLLQLHPIMEVCGQTGLPEEAVTLIREHDPDAVVLDLMLKDSSGFDLLKTLLGEFPHLQVLILSMHDQRIYAERCLKAGALGYVMKEEAADLVVAALQAIAKGERFLSPSLAPGTPAGDQPRMPLERLSNREMQVFELMGSGLPTRAIAKRLELSDKTVEAHKANIKKKLGVEHLQELVRMAMAWHETGR